MYRTQLFETLLFTAHRLLLHAYNFNQDRNILPLDFRDTSRVANIPRERFVNIVLYSYPGTEPNVTRQRGKLMYAESRTPTHRARTYGCRRVFFFFFDARRTYGARDRDTNLFVRSQLVARPFHFSRRARDRSLFTSPGDLWKLIETCIHHRSIGQLSTRRGAAYVSRK